MNTFLVTTKLHIPLPRPDRVFRPRLLQRLEDGLSRGHRMALVSAPAGYGKTTLLAEWVRRGDRPVAWVSLDAGDNDSVRFWSHVAAALQKIHTEAGEPALAALQSPQPLPFEAALTALINGADAIPEPFTLVLDDYHLVEAAGVHGALGFLLEHQPPNMHLVISTRSDPPLPIFRLRARSQLTELRNEDLRFSPDEALAFLNTVMSLDLTREDVASLEARTEGWVVGLQLAALSLQGRADAQSFIAAFTGSHHYVLEYLTEEVLRRQPAPIRQCLMQTSILERLSGHLCDAVLNEGRGTKNEEAQESKLDDSSVVLGPSPTGQEMLAYLQQQNLFVVPLDDEHRWYRYHHLFADLLANLLRKEWPAEHRRKLHRRASQWYEQQGFLDDAIKHALQAQAFERAASLIEQSAQAALAQGRVTTLLGWLEPLPGAVLRARPGLRLYQAWALHLNGQSGAAEEILHCARRGLRALPPSHESAALRGQLAALLTNIAMLHENPSQTIAEAREALTYLPEEDSISRARVHVALGTAHAYEDEPEQAAETWQRASNLALEAGNPFLSTAAIELLAGMRIYHQGRLREGARTLQQVLDLGTTPAGLLLPFTATAHALLAEIYLEWNDLDAAGISLDKGIELLQWGGIAYGMTHTYCAKARLARALGDRAGAIEALQTARRATAALPMWHMILHQAACQTRLSLWLGDVAGAERWANADPATIECDLPDKLPRYLREVQQISLARVCLAQGRVDDALEMLDTLLLGAVPAGRTAHVIEASLMRALALRAQGKICAAMRALETSLSMAEPEGYSRMYLEEGEPSRLLVSEFRSLSLAQPRKTRVQVPRPLLTYADGLLAAFSNTELEIALPPFETLVPRVQNLVEPLTGREREVLQLIGKGYTNQEIAAALVVTVNTVKKHASGIYGKLGVRSRTQAVARAREYGLL